MKPRSGTIEIRAQRQSWGRGVGLLVAGIDDLGNMMHAKDLVFEKHEEDAYVMPTIELRMEAAQQLMDELWNCGLRPTEGTGSAGSLAATQAHLKDMQAVAFGLLERQGVKR